MTEDRLDEIKKVIEKFDDHEIRIMKMNDVFENIYKDNILKSESFQSYFHSLLYGLPALVLLACQCSA